MAYLLNLIYKVMKKLEKRRIILNENNWTNKIFTNNQKKQSIKILVWFEK